MSTEIERPDADSVTIRPSHFPTLLFEAEVDKDLLDYITGLFLQNCGGLVQQMRDAVAAGDGERLERTALAFKNSIVLIGSDDMIQAANHLETMGRERMMNNARTTLDKIERALELYLAWSNESQWFETSTNIRKWD